MQILNTFPTKVGLFSVENNTELNKGLSDFVYSIRNEESPQRSMVGGYHTKEDLLTRNNPFIKSFYSIIVNQISEYFKNFSTKPVGQNTKLVSITSKSIA